MAKENPADNQEEQKIKELIENGEINAISIDTTAFHNSGRRLDGVFGELTQFGEQHPARFVISEVIYNEIRHHLIAHIDEAKSKFTKGMKSMCEFVGGNVEELTILQKKLDDLPNSEERATNQLDSFLEKAKAEIIDADDFLTVGNLIEQYFSKAPPFHIENPKKKEFPDAIALSSLDKWAEVEQTKVLVVSRDGAWSTYCNNSENLFLVKNLATALKLFQKPNEVIEAILKQLKVELEDRDSYVHLELIGAIQNQDWASNSSVEAYSQFEYEENYIDLKKIISMRLANDDALNLINVDADDETLSVEVSVILKVEMLAGFSFQKWDGIDKEYMSMGDTEVTVENLVDLSAIIRLPFKKGKIDEVEVDVQKFFAHLEIEEIEPAWMSNPDNYE